ncbi:MAG: beta-propeller domain-containing protein [archaeon]|nr:beta-propeller domain-containing protein [archaeon]
MKTKFNIFSVAVVLAILAIVLLVGFPAPETGPGSELDFKEIPRFESYGAMLEAFKEAQAQGRSYGVMEALSGGMPMAATSMKNTEDAGSSDGSSDFSTTNVQVEGVDEADIVKTDGKYIYNFSKGKLVITDAYPIQGSRIVSSTELNGAYPLEMFVSEDKLLIFGNIQWVYAEENGGNGEPMPSSMIARDGYYPYYGGTTVAQLYDISDRSTPKLEKTLEFQGEYSTSRLIGKNAYFVVVNHRYYMENNEDDIIPMMADDGVVDKIAEATDIGFISPMPAEGFVTLASINLDSQEVQKETIVGSVRNVFASKNHIYLAGTVWTFPDIPIVEDAVRPIVGDFETTVVNKFGLRDGEVGFVGQGSVPGHVLNQFSMDEFEGKFRVATTSGQLSRMGNGTSNNIYVLDEEMTTIGKLENLAPGESIYSARFMGKKAYLVTFKKVDPLFVIDMSVPTNPTVLGKLKIPGYSDYLHPIDETHLIGLGKDTIEAAKGNFAWYQGIKMAIFDVSDVSNPIEMHKIILGDRGTDSYALRDHKAFLYNKEKELLVLPITLSEIPEELKKAAQDKQFRPSYGEPVFQGAMVFKVTLGAGFQERGRITHVTPEDELKRGSYYGGDYSVKRSLYIGNVLYTLSENMLKANALDSLEELKEFTFE